MEYTTIDEYIDAAPGDARERLRALRSVIRAAAPEATEKISWGMPTWWQKHNLVHVAAHKKHIGFYPTPEAITAFATELTEYSCSKGAVQLPHDKELPLELVARMTAFRVAAVESGAL